MNKCALCSTELKFVNTPTFNSGKLSDGGEICTSCFRKVNNIDPSVAFKLKKHSLADIQELLKRQSNARSLKSPQVDKAKIFATLVTIGLMLWLFFSVKSCFNDTTEFETSMPSNKSDYEGGRGYVTNGEFLAATTEAYLDKASMYIVDSDKKSLDELIKTKAVLYLKPNIQVELVQESSSGYDKVEFRFKGDKNTLWTRRQAIGEWKSKEISKQQYKELWPFTVDKGTLKCIQIRVPGLTVKAVIFEANGASYAINGAAKNWTKKNEYIDGDEIWNSTATIGLIIDDALKLCE